MKVDVEVAQFLVDMWITIVLLHFADVMFEICSSGNIKLLARRQSACFVVSQDMLLL